MVTAGWNVALQDLMEYSWKKGYMIEVEVGVSCVHWARPSALLLSETPSYC